MLAAAFLLALLASIARQRDVTIHEELSAGSILRSSMILAALLLNVVDGLTPQVTSFILQLVPSATVC